MVQRRSPLVNPWSFALALGLSVALAHSAFASPMLGAFSDLISTSAPSADATHRVQFTAVSTIPPSGRIEIVPQSGTFDIPAGFDYTDVDFAVWNGSAYVDRTIAASQGAGVDGVAVVTGSSGSITITLSSSAGIAAGDKVQIRLGTNATFGATGSVSIPNPDTQGSYRIAIDTYDAVGVHLDYASIIIAIVPTVSILMPLLNIPPAISDGLPSGELAAGNPVIELSLTTDRTATCRYATTTGISYNAMTETFSSIQGRIFYTVVGGHQDNTSYTYYVRCAGVQFATSDEYPISFSLSATAVSSTSIPHAGGPSGTGSYPNGSATLYLAGVTLSGFTAPGSTVTVLKDGVQALTTQSGSDGAFQAIVPGLERGTYTFSVYSVDNKQVKSATYASTLTVSPATTNVLSGILIPPTIALDSDSVATGDSVRISGQSAPGSSIDVYVIPDPGTAGDTLHYTASTTGLGFSSGTWEVPIRAGVLQNGTYTVRARTNHGSTQSPLSTPISLGVGQKPSSNLFNRADINKDGKVNLTDFSILLSFWGTGNSSADINEDGIVSLADFSIMLFNWTG